MTLSVLDGSRTYYVPLHLIQDNPWQTRLALHKEHIAALAADIQKNDLRQPPMGRIMQANGQPLTDAPVLDENGYPVGFSDGSLIVQLAFGHNRVAAFRLLAAAEESGGWRYQRIPLFLNHLTDQGMAQAAWAENAQRRDLDAIEEAMAIQRRMSDFGWNQEQVAEELGLARATVTNKLRLLKLPEEVVAKVRGGALSERQALALLPLFDIPEPARERIEAQPYHAYKPSRLLAEAPKLNSDAIRSQVSSAITFATEELARAPFPTDQAVEAEGVRAPCCCDCTMRVTPAKQTPRCGDKGCWNIKEEAWAAASLARARTATGYQALPGSGRGYHVEATTIFNEGLARYASARQCDNLRLTFGSGCRVKGHPNVGLACWHGRGKKCACEAAQKAEERRADPAVAEEKEKKQAYQRQLFDPALEAATEALAQGAVGLWRKVAHEVLRGNQVKDDWTVERCQRAIARHLLDEAMPYNAHMRQEDAKKALAKFFGEAGIALPDEEASLLRGIQRRHARLRSWVDRLAQDLPTVEALQGNIQNLEALHAEAGTAFQQVASSPDGGPMFDTMQAIGLDLSTVRRLERLLTSEEWSADGFEGLGGWVQIPAGDENFKQRLETTPLPVLRYAESWLLGREGHASRVEALARAIKRRSRKEGKQVA